MKTVIIILSLFFVISVSAERWKRQAYSQLCNTPDNFIGVCVTLPNCPSLVNLYGARAGSSEVIEYLKGAQRNCGIRSIRGQPIVCCMEAYRGRQRPAQRPFTFPTSPEPTTWAPPPPDTTSTRPPTTNFVTSSSTPSTTYLPPSPSASSRDLDSCFGPDAKPGTCKGLAQCPILRAELLERQHDGEYARFLRLSNEICAQPPPIVCCPTESTFPRATPEPDDSNETDEPGVTNDIVTRFPIPGAECGYTNNTQKRIVGGEVAKQAAWPWIALLGYDDSLTESPFKCGGALITTKHILTAAHCVRKDLFEHNPESRYMQTFGGIKINVKFDCDQILMYFDVSDALIYEINSALVQQSFVRLGEHDLLTDKEAKHVDIKVAEAIKHPAYSRRDGHSDVAVVRLEKSVKFTDNIKPICLPIKPEARSKTYVDFNPFVAGWGKTLESGQSSNVLREIQIPVHENQLCRDLYARQNKWISYKQFDNAIICAGVLTGGKDTCQGDSGGPLMIPELLNGKYVYSAIGVVSYGIGCARPEIPGVYANVSNFMDWIEENVIGT